MLNLHHQTVTKLRKLLMDEDKHFQATQQQERANHDTAMVSITVAVPRPDSFNSYDVLHSVRRASLRWKGVR